MANEQLSNSGTFDQPNMHQASASEPVTFQGIFLWRLNSHSPGNCGYRNTGLGQLEMAGGANSPGASTEIKECRMYIV